MTAMTDVTDMTAMPQIRQMTTETTRETTTETTTDTTTKTTTTTIPNDSSRHYRAPGAITRRIVNPFVGWLVKRGVTAKGAGVLSVRGRSSGEWRSTPVNPLLFEQAQILDGEVPDDPAAFAARLNRLVVRGLGVPA